MSEPAPPSESTESHESMPTLSSYFSLLRSAVFRHSPALGSSAAVKTSTLNANAAQQGTRATTLIMGNPSADLDSFISAVVLSYFYNLNTRHHLGGSTTTTPTTPTYIPILNLPTVRSSDLWRLRPEFGVALRLALGETPEKIRRDGPGEQGKCSVLEEVVTIADVLADSHSRLYGVFAPGSRSQEDGKEGKDGQDMQDEHDTQDTLEEQDKQNVILVDHNAPSIPVPGVDEQTINSRLNVVGCIDHHVDEGYVSADADPRTITTGIGSCTSLVVTHLRQKGLWVGATTAEPEGIRQIARLALAPVLIDTSNLRGQGDKCSDTDREVVAFLEGVVKADGEECTKRTETTERDQGVTNGTETKWDRDAFHQVIGAAKASSLDLLSMQEVFDRDYKVWTETASARVGQDGQDGQKGHDRQTDVNVGISSLVKPLSWLVEHAGGVAQFLDEVDKFADARELGVYAMLTPGHSGKGKEVLVLGLDEPLGEVVQKFEDMGGEELRLTEWEEDTGLIRGLDEWTATKKGGWKIWWMGDTSKSRKQVGPLLREAVRSI